jgi:hypothetical protein
VSADRTPRTRKGQQLPTAATPRARLGQRQAPAPIPRARPASEQADGYPSFSFQWADHTYTDGSWSWFNDSEAAEVLKFLADVSRSTWNEIKTQTTGGKNRRKKHHDQPVDGLCKEAQDRLSALHLDEIFPGEIFRFRLGGTKRLWGFVVEGVFYVIWWDRDHKVYPTEPS